MVGVPSTSTLNYKSAVVFASSLVIQMLFYVNVEMKIVQSRRLQRLRWKRTYSVLGPPSR